MALGSLGSEVGEAEGSCQGAADSLEIGAERLRLRARVSVYQLIVIMAAYHGRLCCKRRPSPAKAALIVLSQSWECWKWLLMDVGVGPVRFLGVSWRRAQQREHQAEQWGGGAPWQGFGGAVVLI